MRREPPANVREGSDNTRNDDTDRCQSSQQAGSAKCRRPLICRCFRSACQSDSPIGNNRYSSKPGPARTDQIEIDCYIDSRLKSNKQPDAIRERVCAPSSRECSPSPLSLLSTELPSPALRERERRPRLGESSQERG
jgi:hypothetical protein